MSGRRKTQSRSSVKSRGSGTRSKKRQGRAKKRKGKRSKVAPRVAGWDLDEASFLCLLRVADKHDPFLQQRVQVGLGQEFCQDPLELGILREGSCAAPGTPEVGPAGCGGADRPEGGERTPSQAVPYPRSRVCRGPSECVRASPGERPPVLCVLLRGVCPHPSSRAGRLKHTST